MPLYPYDCVQKKATFKDPDENVLKDQTVQSIRVLTRSALRPIFTCAQSTFLSVL